MKEINNVGLSCQAIKLRNLAINETWKTCVGYIIVLFVILATYGVVFANSVRISAIIDVGDTVKVGVVNQETGNSFLLGVNEENEGITLISADYNEERICLLVKGSEMWFNLQGDPVLRMESENRVMREQMISQLPADLGETINQLLLENPQAQIRIFNDPFIGTATNVISGLGPGIEKLLAEQGIDPATLPKTAEGKGESIERFLKETPPVEPGPTDELSEQYGEGIGKLIREGKMEVLEGDTLLPPAQK